ncbi:diaminohydroxyphosphoribosylaminopyrimidine deaminase [Varunaivibrio sulfuroxidans]|uniref:Riboflavin biosynthesis protein RibD n=2 Tax=Varunaivibrio sulfuroxidans TaxID=1773489 RepID=A0A4R3JHJ5_9PROT|nr:diaminohydroxyphosphoribosylaminopyrimidine deaminase [Varunaivibrio sulfuroxidans]
MRVALGLARRALGRVHPNPAVGCLLVRDGDVVGRGWTQAGGRPHGETMALRQAGAAARGATAYVTLEPCSHHGQTPPCAAALIAAGVKRVVVATTDPDPRVSGAGIRALEEAGVAVTLNVLKDEADDLNAGFFLRITRQRPLFTLKSATTLDGRIATGSGQSQWITGPEARARGHLLRAQHDAILTGVSTVVADDPSLTCRIDGLSERSPIRVVLDGALKIPVRSTLVRSAAEVPLWVFHHADANLQKCKALKDVGVEMIAIKPDNDTRLNLPEVAHILAQRGLTRVLVEAGATLSGAFVAENLVDRIAWFQAPSLIGADGLAAIGPLKLETLACMARFDTEDVIPCGVDTLAFLRRKP